jgi:hypothetical protein
VGGISNRLCFGNAIGGSSSFASLGCRFLCHWCASKLVRDDGRSNCVAQGILVYPLKTVFSQTTLLVLPTVRSRRRQFWKGIKSTKLYALKETIRHGDSEKKPASRWWAPRQTTHAEDLTEVENGVQRTALLQRANLRKAA